jgi:hypothetical protein
LAEQLGPTARCADVARAVLTHAEQEVRDLRSLGLSAAEQSARSREIVARAQRDVSEILAGGHEPLEPADPQHSPQPVVAPFARLRAQAMPAEPGELRYRICGRLTLAMLLAFQQAVGRLPGVTSASVSAEPDDVADLRLKTSDPSLFEQLLLSMPGVELQLEVEGA